MTYRRRYRTPQVRTITVKYEGPCACCGGTIKVGEIADYFPVGTIASRTTPAIAHTGGLSGNSAKCAGIIRAKMSEPEGDVTDRMYEDQCAAICGR